MQIETCKSCGGIIERRGNYYVCQSCGNKWVIDADNDVHVIDRANAWSALRDCDFERASELFETIIFKEPKNHEAYWGRALAGAGIIYVSDLNENKKVPTCNSISEDSFINNSDVKKAIDLAPAEISKAYKKQSEQIEKIRLEWLEKARKEPPYDVFISFKDSDREHGLERTEDSVDAQDLYNALVAEGFKVFFSRISLRNKISEQYEPYIYNAIKTAKVMIVFGEKAEYFNSVWIKNEWNRFRFRIENGEKHKNSLVVVYKNMDPGELPVALKTRQCLNAAEMTFLPDLLRHIKRVVEESEQAMHIERVEIKGGQISKRASKIANESIATREIGEGASAETNISEKQKLDLVKSYIKGKEWRDAADLLEHILFDHPTYAEAIWLTLAVKYNVVSDAEIIKKLPRFTDPDFFQIEKILNCATKGFAAHLLNLLYDSHSDVDSATYHKVVKTILPYNYENRGEKIDLIFERAIQMHDFKLFKLAQSTMDSNEVDRYIDYNLRYSENAKLEEKLECITAVLDVDNGNARALALKFETIRQNAKFSKLRECFEDMLKYSSDPQKVVLTTLSSWVNYISTSDHCQFAMQLLKYYDGELSELKDTMVLLAAKMLECGFFEDANRLYKLILTFDTNNAQAFWGICLVKTKSRSEKEVINSNVSIKGLPEYTKYLTLVDEKRRQDCMSVAKKQATRQKAQKRKKTVRIITALSIFLVISAILTVYVVLPTIEKQKKYESAISLFNGDKYDDANEIFTELDGFLGSQKYVAVINGIQYLEDGRAYYLDQGIRIILTAGVPVKVQFDVENGGFPKGNYTSGGYDSGISFLSAAKRPRITNLSASNGSNVVEVTYSNLDQFKGLEVAGRNGYSFVQWLVEDYSYTDGKAFELKLKAKWEFKEYPITYDVADGVLTGSVQYSYTMDTPDFKLATPYREGYDFIGWSGTGLSAVTMDVTVSKGSFGDRKYVAQWKAHEFTATLDANGGTLDQTTITVEYGSIPGFPTPTKTGYTFDGWYVGDVKYSDTEWKVQSDLTLVAKWTAKSYDLTFEDTTDVKGTVDVTFDKNCPEGTTETDTEGYDNEISIEDAINIGLSLGHNEYTDEKYYVTGTVSEVWNSIYGNMYLVDGEGNFITIYGSYNEDGSLRYDEPSYVDKPVAGDVITIYGIVGQYDGSPQIKNGWIVSRATDETETGTGTETGTKTDTDTKTEAEETFVVELGNGDVLEYPENPTAPSYVFIGWYTDPECTQRYNFSGTIREDMTLYAGWSRNTHTNDSNYPWTVIDGVLTSTNKNGSSTSSYKITAAVDMTVSFDYATSSESGCDVLRIFVNGEEEQSCSGSTEYYSYSVDLNEGDVLEFKYSKDGSASIGNDCAYIRNLNYTAAETDYTSTAVASPNRIQGFEYSADSDYTISITYGQEYVLPTPVREGYMFLGWYNGDTPIESGVWTFDTDLTLTPRWDATGCVVTFDPNGGSCGDDETVLSYGEEFILPIPTRTGYTFDGWYAGDVKYENGIWTGTEDVTLVAKWVATSYNVTYEDITDIKSNIEVTFDKNYTESEATVQTEETESVETETTEITEPGSSETTEPTTTETEEDYFDVLENGDVLEYPENPIRPGYVFTGWYTDPECTTKYTFEGTLTEDITLYAGWTDPATNDSNYPWTVVDGVLTSTNKNGSSTSSYKITAAVDMTVSFDYATSSESGYDYLYVYVNGSRVQYCSGLTEYYSYSVNLNEGDVLEFRYSKDGGTSNGSDCAYIKDLTYISRESYTSTASASCGNYDGHIYDAENDLECIVNFGDKLPTPIREGYTFLGWYNGDTPIESATWNMDADATLTPMWQAVSYTVTLDTNGGSELESTTLSVVYDSEVTLPTPTKTGYTFLGWYAGEQKYESGIWTGTEDVALVASWTISSYDVTYEDMTEVKADIEITFDKNYTESEVTVQTEETESVETETTEITEPGSSETTEPTTTETLETGEDYFDVLENGDVLEYPENPIRPGYVFTGWYTDPECTTKYTFEGTLTEDITLYAGWTDPATNDSNYPWTFVEGILTSANKNHSSSSSYHITAIADMTVSFEYATSSESGYDYLHIYVNGSQVQSCSGSTEYSSYSVNLNEGDVLEFRYSKDGSSSSGSDCAYIKDLTYVSRESYTSTAVASCDEYEGFEYKEGSDIVISVNHGEEIQIHVPMRPGYNFLGWYNGEELVNVESLTVESDITLTARWEAIRYTITLDANGGEVDATTVEITSGAEYTLPTPTRTGYTFDGWYYDGEKIVSDTWTIAGDVTIVANWIPHEDITYVVNHYKQNADDDEYTLFETENFIGTAGASITPEVKSYEGFNTPAAQTVTVAPDGSLVVNYYYVVKTYDLIYVTNGGDAMDNKPCRYDRLPVADTPTREGYTFGGWFTDAALTTEFNATQALTADLTLYAYWTEENKPGDFSYDYGYDHEHSEYNCGVWKCGVDHDHENDSDNCSYDYYYDCKYDHIIINAYNGSSSTMWIPVYIGGVPVTTINSYAFENNIDFIKAVVPETVTHIGSYAFEGCIMLEDITVPFIGTSANASQFKDIVGYNATTIKNVTVTVQTEIPENAFYGCSYIESIAIPDNVTSIGNYAFYGCSALKRLNSDVDGEFSIPESVTSIGTYAFSDLISIKKLEMPDALESIGSYAFSGCVSIEEVKIPATVTSIGSNAFNGCVSISKINSDVEGELNLFSGLESIGEYAFYNLPLITKVTVPETVTWIGGYAFDGCTMLEDITLPFVGVSADATGYQAKLQYIVGDNATMIKNVTVTVQTVIPNEAFINFGSIESITIPETVTSIGNNAFYNCSSLKRLNSETEGEIKLPAAITSIGEYTFYGCGEIQRIKFIDQSVLESIGDYAFYGCFSIEEIQIPETVTGIGNYAFSGCISISKVNSDTEGEMMLPTSLTSIGEYAFQNLALITKVTVPKTVTEIGFGAFKGCTIIADITLPFVGKSADAVGHEAVFGYIFGYTTSGYYGSSTYGSDSISNDYINTMYGSAESGSIWQYSSHSYRNGSYYYDTSYFYYVPTNIKNVAITVQTEIPTAAFNNCSFIEVISIPMETTSIGDYAFQNCSSLSGAWHMPWSVDKIGAYTFYGCGALTEIGFGGNFSKLESIGEYAFSGCISLEAVQIPDTVISIGDHAFSGCIAISKINSDTEGEMKLPTGLITIGQYAFQNLSEITKVTVPETVSEIGIGAFKGCNAIADITLPFVGKNSGATAYDAVFGYIFGYESQQSSRLNESPDDTYINTNYGGTPDGTVWQYSYKAIYSSSYPGRSYPTSLYYYIPTTIRNVTITVQTEIPVAAFNNCSFIETITIPKTVTSEGDYAFQNCEATINRTHIPSRSYWNGTSVSEALLGSGTEVDPYQINSAADLAFLASAVNNGTSYEGMYFVLNADINLNSHNWTPIGTKNTPFAGIFDGNGKRIYNLSVNTNTAYAGLFGYVSGTVKELGILSGTLSPSSSENYTYIGALVGYLTGTVENCYSSATIDVSLTYMAYAGGLVGYVDSTAKVEDSYASGNVSVTSSNGFTYVGGVVGYNKGIVEGCLAFGNVTARGQNDSYSRNGGLVARNDGGTVTECYRSESQVLIKNTTEGAAYCNEGTVASVSDMISYAETNWDSSVWDYSLRYPAHK